MSLKPASSSSDALFLTAWKGVGEALRKSTNSFAWLTVEVDMAAWYQFFFVMEILELLATVNIDCTVGRLSMKKQDYLGYALHTIPTKEEARPLVSWPLTPDLDKQHNDYHRNQALQLY